MRSWAQTLLLSCVCLTSSILATDADRLHLSGQRSRRTVGGLVAPHIPWQVMVYLGDTAFDGGYAGGALISDRWVLTAARNLFVNKTRPPPAYPNDSWEKHSIPKVYVGITDRVLANSSNQAEVEKVVLHPDFRKTNVWENDLALIKLKEPVTFGETVTPIPLPERGDDVAETEGMRGVLAGWGWGALLTPANQLKYIILPVAKHEACRQEYEGRSDGPKVDEKVFCTSTSAFHENVCFGDAGGALAVQDAATGRVYAAGILSYDKTCTIRKHAVYAKLSAYVPWIYSVMRGDSETLSEQRNKLMNYLYSKQ
nr:haptoglobin-like [Paramormyrops kingsleyae]